MIHLIAPTDQPTEDPVLRGMFAARKQVFVDLLKWDVPVIADTFEIDLQLAMREHVGGKLVDGRGLQRKDAAPLGARSAGQSVSLDHPAPLPAAFASTLRHAIVTEGRDAHSGSVEQAREDGIAE